LLVTMMDRWTQYDQDSYRLPQGLIRIGYDDQSQRHFFRDTNSGRIYQGEPRAEFGGVLTPTVPFDEESMVWGKPGRSTTRNLPTNLDTTSPPPKSFSDILPPSLIASSSPPPCPNNNPYESSTDRLRRVVRSKALPKMQGVVHNVMRRTATMKMKGNNDDDTRSMMSEKGLLEGDTEHKL